jgi:outer membrane protein TolC
MNRTSLVLALLLAAPAARAANPAVPAPPAAGAPSPSAGPAVETLSLPDALARLDAKSFPLAVARARADEAAALVRQARAQLLPTVVAAGSYVRNNDDARLSIARIFDGIEAGLSQATGRPVTLDRSGVPSDTVIQPLDSFTASATVRVPLLVPTGLADVAAARRAGAAEDARLAAARADLRTALVQAAYGEAAAREVIRAAERALAAATEHRDAARRAVQAGIAAPLSLLTAQTEVTRTSSERVRAESALEGARLAVGALLGEARPIAVETPEPEVPADAAPALDVVLAARPEVRASAETVAAAEKALLSARLRHLPQLSASGSAFASTEPYPTGDETGWRATVDLGWTLYDGGYRYGKADEAEARLAGARAAFAARREDVSREVQDAAREVRVAGERLALARQGRETAAEAAAVAERGFAAGQAGSLDVVDANERLYGAEVALADARARLGVAALALARATGRAP